MADKQVDGVSMATKFRIEVCGHGFVPCESYSGGNPSFDKASVTHGNSPYAESTAGQPSVDEITITSYVTPDCKVWPNVYMKTFIERSPDCRFDLTIFMDDVSGNVVQQLDYKDCLMVSYDFPTCVAGSGELLLETVSVKPGYLEVQGG